jgi:hypothetical protein
MKKIYTCIFFLAALFSSSILVGQTFWNGPKITFTKAANADWTLEENQDRITDSVWITRQTMWSIYNIQKGEISSFTDCQENPGQPYDTEWAYGTIADGVENLTFDNFLGPNFVNCAPGEPSTSPVDKDAVLHLISEDIYIDIKFLDWGIGGNGGGSFSYERTTDPFVSVHSIQPENTASVFPNPVKDELFVAGLSTEKPADFQVYDTMGRMVQSGQVAPQQGVAVANLANGIYYLHLPTEGQVVRFVKW